MNSPMTRYRSNCVCIFKLKRGRGVLVQELRDHSANVNDIIELADNTIVSAANDNSIRFWSLVNGKYKCTNTVANAHEGPVMSRDCEPF